MLCLFAQRSLGEQTSSEWKIVFANSTWYRECTEKEKIFQGVLLKNTTVQGPAGRPGLGFILRLENKNFPVYSANIDQVLNLYLGKNVSVRAKRVDFKNEGFGVEIWIGYLKENMN